MTRGDWVSVTLTVGLFSFAGEARSEDLQAQGMIDAAALRRRIEQHLPQIRRCYERGLTVSPTLTGRVVLRVVVGDRGLVTEVSVATSTLASPLVEGCLVRSARTWRFLPAPPGLSYSFSYPMIFEPATPRPRRLRKVR